MAKEPSLSRQVFCDAQNPVDKREDNHDQRNTPLTNHHSLPAIKGCCLQVGVEKLVLQNPKIEQKEQILQMFVNLNDLGCPPSCSPQQFFRVFTFSHVHKTKVKYENSSAQPLPFHPQQQGSHCIFLPQPLLSSVLPFQHESRPG